MQLPRLYHALIAFALAASCGAAEAPSPVAVRASLAKATDYLTSIATEGGYLWKYSTDLRERFGENKATATQIWVQPPGTPSVGMAFLEAYLGTRDEKHLRAAQAAAQALVRGQLASGGWDYLVEFDPKARGGWGYRADHDQTANTSVRRRNTTTFDDDNTQSALRFLLAFLDVATNRPTAELKPIREALDYGLVRMIEAQYPNGGWPQRYSGRPHDPAKYPVRPAGIPQDWPRVCPKHDYGSYYTLNDDTQRDCILTMLEAWKRLGNSKYLDAAKRGGDFLILARLPEPQAGWAQQYNPAMEPAWARAFEPPSVCSAESGGAMRTLVDLFLATGEQRYLDPLPAFVAWLKRSAVAPDRWARYYELHTNKPLYGDRDGKIHYTLAEISEERQHGYSWQGSYGIPQTIAYHEEVRAQGRDKYRARERAKKQPSRPALEEISRILAQQDSQGRWLDGSWVQTRTFIANMRALSASLASAPQREKPTTKAGTRATSPTR